MPFSKEQMKEWWHRDMDSKAYFRNHRKMLKHMLARAERKFVEAVSAVSAAEDEGDPGALAVARGTLRRAEAEVAWQKEKQTNLDEHDIIILQIDAKKMSPKQIHMNKQVIIEEKRKADAQERASKDWHKNREPVDSSWRDAASDQSLLRAPVTPPLAPTGSSPSLSPAELPGARLVASEFSSGSAPAALGPGDSDQPDWGKAKQRTARSQATPYADCRSIPKSCGVWAEPPERHRQRSAAESQRENPGARPASAAASASTLPSASRASVYVGAQPASPFGSASTSATPAAQSHSRAMGQAASAAASAADSQRPEAVPSKARPRKPMPKPPAPIQLPTSIILKPKSQPATNVLFTDVRPQETAKERSSSERRLPGWMEGMGAQPEIRENRASYPWRSEKKVDLASIPPKPDRDPWFVLESKHEALPDLDDDWTLCPEDFGKELKLRQVRNQMIKEALLKGRKCFYRSSGNSLAPRVRSGNGCCYHPVTNADEVNENDIVFCEVQPGDRFYAHVVKYKYWHTGDPHEPPQWAFIISNIKGRENGWCYMEHIYGKCVEIQD